jgi:malonyl CoA-acyl carrier protein transacylase
MLNQGTTTFVEFGPKAVLKGLLRRIDRSATGIALETAADIQAILEL